MKKALWAALFLILAFVILWVLAPGVALFLIATVALYSNHVMAVPLWVPCALIAYMAVRHLKIERDDNYPQWRNLVWHECVEGFPVSAEKATRYDFYGNAAAMTLLNALGFFLPGSHVALVGWMMTDVGIHFRMKWRVTLENPPGFKNSWVLVASSVFLIIHHWKWIDTHPYIAATCLAVGCLPLAGNYLDEGLRARRFHAGGIVPKAERFIESVLKK